MLGFYNYTVILTYLGMLTGFSGITCLITGNKKGALTCLLIAGLCDMFDGKIASTMIRTKQEKHFGIQIDSLSDLICFGVLPALIVYTSDTGAACFVSAGTEKRYAVRMHLESLMLLSKNPLPATWSSKLMAWRLYGPKRRKNSTRNSAAQTHPPCS